REREPVSVDGSSVGAEAGQKRRQFEHPGGHSARQRRRDSGTRSGACSGQPEVMENNASMSAVVLGIDGGGTRTRASIVDGERVLAFAEAGSIKRLRVGEVVAEENLRSLLGEVYKQAGVNGVEAASAGVASATMPGVPEWIQAVFADFDVKRSEVVGDEVIALDAAFRGQPGILQIAGTGTNCIGRAPDGGREAAGGWSSRLGDEGSGYWIGLHAVRRALNAYDREQPTRVLEVVGRLWNTNGIEELV